MGTTVLAIFLLVYLGMLLGKLPGLALDRTGVALLGAIAMVSVGALPLDDAWRAVDVPTVTLLFALMVVSAQFRLAGFYAMLTRWITARKLSPGGLLGLVILASGGLSALLTNDVVCLAVTPILIEGCRRRQLSPVPFLLGLACASNVGSAATLIGNPQNILIGQTLGLGFGQFLLDAGVPAGLGLGLTWAVIRIQYADRFHGEIAAMPADPPPAYDRWQSSKAIAVCVVLVGAFCFLPELPRHGVALTAAGVLLLSRRMSSRRTLALVDWQLLVLFIGLFVVNAALAATGAVGAGLEELR
jgi:Na+/H+ antiporter NhaD/arsenite permease-like protein